MLLLILKKLFLFNSQLHMHVHSVRRFHCGFLEMSAVTKDIAAKNPSGVLSRLAGNEEGNVIAILAAAVLPVLGLVGGGIDISRLYLTQSKLQGACDSGALLGRKIMGMGTWNAEDAIAGRQALQIFDQNFSSGAYGSHSLARSYSEANGNVTGTASATVPMALMQIFGEKEKVITVNCKAELRIPNTDVMFVLDTTGSMEQIPVNSSVTKMVGLRRAVKCFYEALAKQNIDDITPAECNETVNPVNTNSPNVQLRFGFVPYSVNVNVVNLLKHEHMVDSFTYQSRVALTVANEEATPVYGQESGQTPIDNVTINENNTGWQNATTPRTDSSGTYAINPSATASQCAQLASPATYNVPTVTSQVMTSQIPAIPVSPQNILTRYYTKESREASREFNYFFSNNSCILRFRDKNRTLQRERTSTTTAITWPLSNFKGWTYRPVQMNVSHLKGPNGSWRTSLPLPVGANGTTASIGWSGCVEERKTARGTDMDPTDDWDPIPADALDMDIDLAPNADTNTKWAPHLRDIIYMRNALEMDAYGNRVRSSTPTLSDVFVHNYESINMPTSTSNCPSRSTKIAQWAPAGFKQYVNDLTTNGFTYHDIGLLWGARIMSPTGIFADTNATPDKTIDRHMIFMTDGETAVKPEDYSAYGVHWYDRRQTPTATAPTETQLIAMTDARTAALCKAIKDRNITLWVVSYGNVNSATNNRLRGCASTGRFFEAQSVGTLITRFKAIAAEISALRLTE